MVTLLGNGKVTIINRVIAIYGQFCRKYEAKSFGARIFLKSPLVCSNLFLVHITYCFQVSTLAGFFLDTFPLQEFFVGELHGDRFIQV